MTMMRATYLIAFCLTCQLYTTFATVHFREDFDTSSWEERWIQSKHDGKEYGKFEWTAGTHFGDAEKDKGLKTSQDAHFYALSTKFDDKKFSNEGKDLVLQFSVKHEQNIDCGGGYIKVFDCSLDPSNLHGDSPYLIMFGPDICGPGTRKVHVIFNYKGKNLLINKEIKCKDDVDNHVYRLVVKPDNTYSVAIDNEVVEKGKLEEDWSFLEPKKIPDPDAKKPEDWVDDEKIPDPDDKKPADWDKPELIPDPAATKPDDWDDEMDGEWEPPKIQNPEYKGEWRPKEIDNPNYKGEWVHPEIDNPKYQPDDKLYMYPEICAAGLDLWQVKSGSIFDNILIGDDENEAVEAAREIIERAKLATANREKAEEEERKKKEEDEESKKDAEVDKEEDENEIKEPSKSDEDKEGKVEEESEEKHDEL